MFYSVRFCDVIIVLQVAISMLMWSDICVEYVEVMTQFQLNRYLSNKDSDQFPELYFIQ